MKSWKSLFSIKYTLLHIYKCFLLKMFHTVLLEIREKCYYCFHTSLLTIFPDELCISSRKISQKFTSTSIQLQ